MRIIGKDGKEYASVKECILADKVYDEKMAEAEKAAAQEKKALEIKLEQEKNAISKRKKELSAAIEKAEEDYVLVQGLYEDAKKKADEILKAAKEEANNILQAAAKELETASNNKVQAIATFNKEFGPYKTIITGSKARDDYNRILRNINRFFNDNFWLF